MAECHNQLGGVLPYGWTVQDPPWAREKKKKKKDYSDLWGFHRKRRRHRGVGVILGMNTVGDSFTTVVDAVEGILVLVDIIAIGTQ